MKKQRKMNVSDEGLRLAIEAVNKAQLARRLALAEVKRQRMLSIRDEGLRQAVQAVGTKAELARRLGITPQAIAYWKQIPADRIIDIETITGVDRKKLRPDLYGPRSLNK